MAIELSGVQFALKSLLLGANQIAERSLPDSNFVASSEGVEMAAECKTTRLELLGLLSLLLHLSLIFTCVRLY